MFREKNIHNKKLFELIFYLSKGPDWSTGTIQNDQLNWYLYKRYRPLDFLILPLTFDRWTSSKLLWTHDQFMITTFILMARITIIKHDID